MSVCREDRWVVRTARVPFPCPHTPSTSAGPWQAASRAKWRPEGWQGMAGLGWTSTTLITTSKTAGKDFAVETFFCPFYLSSVAESFCRRRS